MRSFDYPVIFDATHSVQLIGGAGTKSSGNREFVPNYSRVPVASGKRRWFVLSVLLTFSEVLFEVIQTCCIEYHSNKAMIIAIDKIKRLGFVTILEQAAQVLSTMRKSL